MIRRLSGPPERDSAARPTSPGACRSRENDRWPGQRFSGAAPELAERPQKVRQKVRAVVSFGVPPQADCTSRVEDAR